MWTYNDVLPIYYLSADYRNHQERDAFSIYQTLRAIELR